MCFEGGETLLFLEGLPGRLLGVVLPPVRLRLLPAWAAATVEKSSLSEPNSTFLKFTETDLSRAGVPGPLNCREEEEMVEIGVSMGKETVESPRTEGGCQLRTLSRRERGRVGKA